MGTCCAVCLVTKVRDYAPNAQNGAITVRIIENPMYFDDKTTWVASGDGHHITRRKDGLEINWSRCDVCKAPAEFTVSYYPKKADIEFVGVEE